MKLRYLSEAPLFNELPPDAIEQISERMRLEHYGKGETIFSQGEPSRAFYLVKSGWVRLVARAAGNLATLGPGSLVGDGDMLAGQSHSTSAIAVDDVELWAITAETLEELVTADPALGLQLSRIIGRRIAPLDRYLVETRLRQVPALCELCDEELRDLALELDLVSLPPDSMIFCEGDCANGMFIVEKGAIAAYSAEMAETEQAVLKAGEMLGEMALLTGKTHTLSARTIEHTDLWVLSVQSFAGLAARYPGIRKALSADLRSRLSATDQAGAASKLRAIPLFSNLSDDALADVAGALLLRHVPAGEVVYAQGDAGDALYIVEAGQVGVVGGGSASGAQLGAGDFFGEAELLSGERRADTVRAEANANLWMLGRADFERLVAEYAGVSLLEVEHLDYLVYLQLRRDAWIARLDETEAGREYLDNAWRLGQTKPERDRLRGQFGR